MDPMSKYILFFMMILLIGIINVPSSTGRAVQICCTRINIL